RLQLAAHLPAIDDGNAAAAITAGVVARDLLGQCREVGATAEARDDGVGFLAGLDQDVADADPLLRCEFLAMRIVVAARGIRRRRLRGRGLLAAQELLTEKGPADVSQARDDVGIAVESGT